MAGANRARRRAGKPGGLEERELFAAGAAEVGAGEFAAGLVEAGAAGGDLEEFANLVGEDAFAFEA